MLNQNNELGNFIKDLTEELNQQLKLKSEYQMIDDIICIYKGLFGNYDEYKKFILDYNCLIRKNNEEQLQKCLKSNDYNFKFSIYNNRILLSQEVFEYIKLKGGVNIG